jgi:hypothetical protein
VTRTDAFWVLKDLKNFGSYILKRSEAQVAMEASRAKLRQNTASRLLWPKNDDRTMRCSTATIKEDKEI